MIISDDTLRLVEFLKTYSQGKDFEKDGLAGLCLMSKKKKGFAEKLIAYCNEHPNANDSDIYLAAANIYNENS